MIELKNFEIKGKNSFILRIEELSVSGGQCIQICGNNNSGKSLLLKTLAGIHQDFSGSLLYNGLPEKAGNYRVLLIDDFNAVITPKSVKYNLYLPLKKISKRKQVHLDKMLETTQLQKKLDYNIAELSRSEIKSLELVRAIIQQPHFVLFDDLDTYFDKATLENLQYTLEYANKTGTSIISTTKSMMPDIETTYMIRGGEVFRHES